MKSPDGAWAPQHISKKARLVIIIVPGFLRASTSCHLQEKHFMELLGKVS